MVYELKDVELDILGHEVARLLGWTLTVAGSHSVNLTAEDGTGVNLRMDRSGRDIRVNVHGVWPVSPADGHQVYWPERDNRHTISVAFARGAQALANAITNRLLPVYLPVYAEQVTRMNADLDYARQTEIAVAKVLAVAPQARKSMHGDAIYLGGDSHGYAVRCSSNSVRFEAFDVPLEVALKLLPLLHKP